MKNQLIKKVILINSIISLTLIFFGITKANGQNISTEYIYIPPVINYSEAVAKILIGKNEKMFLVGSELNPANARNGSITWQGIIKRSHPNGEIDTSFGDKGKISILLGNEGCEVHSGLIQKDGKIVVAGIYKTTKGNFFFLSRYNQNGKLDKKFGKNGVSVLNSDGQKHITVAEIALQKDEKILLLGNIQSKNHNMDFFISRILPNGNLDSSFNSTGIVDIKLSEHPEFGSDIELQEDGKILIAGTTDNESGLSENFSRSLILLRFLENGHLDKTFGDDGLLQFKGPHRAYQPSKIQVINEHKIIVAGNNFKTTEISSIFLLILDLRNKLNPNLEENHITFFSSKVGSGYQLNDMILLEDHSLILVANDEQNASNSMYLAHFNSEGNLDKKFGKEGVLTLDVGSLMTTTTTDINFHENKYLYITGKSKKETEDPSRFILKLNIQ